MTAHNPKTRVVQVTVTATNCNIRMYWERWYHRGSTLRQKAETRIVVGTTGLEPSDDDLSRYAYAMAFWVVDPQRRHIRAPRFLRWRQVAQGEDVTAEHGSDVDDRQMAMDLLPLDGGWREPPQPSTIMSGRSGRGGSAAKRLRSSPKAPTVRNLMTRARAQVDGD